MNLIQTIRSAIQRLKKQKTIRLCAELYKKDESGTLIKTMANDCSNLNLKNWP